MLLLKSDGEANNFPALDVRTGPVGVVRPPGQPHLAPVTEHVAAGRQEDVVLVPAQRTAQHTAASASLSKHYFRQIGF